MNSYWLEDEVVLGECKKGIFGYCNANLGMADPLTEWEAFKTTLRGTFTAITGVLRKNIQKHTEDLETTMLTAESAYVASPDSDTRDIWLQCRRAYKLRLLDPIQKRIPHTAQKSFEHSNNAGRLLAYLTRPDRSPISIPCILTSQGIGGLVTPQELSWRPL